MKRTAASLVMIVSLTCAVSAGQQERILNVRQAPYQPILEGKLISPVWRSATVFTKFHALQPTPGSPTTERTVGYMMYDNQFLYVGMRLDDKQPGAIRSDAKLPEDVAKDDWVAVCVDPTEDHRHAQYFLVNAANVRVNGTIDAHGSRTPATVKTWHSAATRGANGWCAEFAIPLDTIGIKLKDKAIMSFKFIRSIARTGEQQEGPSTAFGEKSPFDEFLKLRFFAKK